MTKMQYAEIFLIPERKMNSVKNLEEFMAKAYFTTSHDWLLIKYYNYSIDKHNYNKIILTKHSV